MWCHKNKQAWKQKAPHIKISNTKIQLPFNHFKWSRSIFDVYMCVIITDCRKPYVIIYLHVYVCVSLPSVHWFKRLLSTFHVSGSILGWGLEQKTQAKHWPSYKSFTGCRERDDKRVSDKNILAKIKGGKWGGPGREGQGKSRCDISPVRCHLIRGLEGYGMGESLT